MLQKMQENYTKLRNAMMKSSETSDPLSRFPPEIAEMVCRQLSMRDRV